MNRRWSCPSELFYASKCKCCLICPTPSQDTSASLESNFAKQETQTKARSWRQRYQQQATRCTHCHYKIWIKIKHWPLSWKSLSERGLMPWESLEVHAHQINHTCVLKKKSLLSFRFSPISRNTALQFCLPFVWEKQEPFHLTVCVLLGKYFFLVLFHCPGRAKTAPCFGTCCSTEQGEGLPTGFLSTGTAIQWW